MAPVFSKKIPESLVGFGIFAYLCGDLSLYSKVSCDYYVRTEHEEYRYDIA